LGSVHDGIAVPSREGDAELITCGK
jgi:hypothetical protein